MFKKLKILWLDITNRTDERGFTKKMRQEKKKLDNLHKKMQDEKSGKKGIFSKLFS